MQVILRDALGKLGQAGELIETVRGVGYRFVEEEPEEEEA